MDIRSKQRSTQAHVMATNGNYYSIHGPEGASPSSLCLNPDAEAREYPHSQITEHLQAEDKNEEKHLVFPSA